MQHEMPMVAEIRQTQQPGFVAGDLFCEVGIGTRMKAMHELVMNALKHAGCRQVSSVCKRAEVGCALRCATSASLMLPLSEERGKG